jgi:hypothetical protein
MNFTNTEDPGLWFLNGLVVSAKIKDAVWRVWQKTMDSHYDERFAMEARHRKEAAAMDKKYAAILAKEPYTPWVGRADEGKVQDFVDRARATLAHRRTNAKTKSNS